MLASHALALVGVPVRRVFRMVQDQREARYSMLRGYFHGADDSSFDELEHERFATVSLPLDCPWLAKPLSALALHAVGVRVVSLRRINGTTEALTDDSELRFGDTLVLSGKPAALALAEQKFLRG